MSARKTLPKRKTVPRGRLNAQAGQSRAGEPGNGLKTFSMHALDERAAPMLAKLREERPSYPMFAMEGEAGTATLDPETVAQRYLAQALASKSVPELTAPKSEGTESEFKTLGTETVSLTATKTVKFRQTFNKIPVYGSLVTVELDDANNLVSINSSLGEPKGVSPVAKLAPADAVKAVQKYPGYKKDLENIVPHLYYYFDNPNA